MAGPHVELAARDAERSEAITERVARLRARLREYKARNAHNGELCNVLAGMLDLLGDEL